MVNNKTATFYAAPDCEALEDTFHEALCSSPDGSLEDLEYEDWTY